jgi:hypothetical protein
MHTKDEFFRAIGFISVLFATLDLIISLVILRLQGWAKGHATPFSDRTTLGQKLTILGKLTSEQVTDPDALLSLQQHLPRAQAIAEERNRYIHDQWIFEAKLIAQGKIKRARLVNGSITDDQELTLHDLNAFAREIGDLQAVFDATLRSLDPRSLRDSGV